MLIISFTSNLHVYFLPQDSLVKLVSSVRNLMLWYVSLMLYQITGSNNPMGFCDMFTELDEIVMMIDK